MLGKLMKYDLRSCFRQFGFIWIAILVLSLINSLLLNSAFEAQTTLGAFLTTVLPNMVLFGLYVALAVLSIIYVIERFYKGLLGDEGYLMFTLPATPTAHLFSKGFTAVIMELISALVAMLSGLIFLLCVSNVGFHNFVHDLRESLSQVSVPGGLWWIALECLVLLLLVCLETNFRLYTAMSLGHLAKKHRAAWSVAAYIGINFVLRLCAALSINAVASLGVFSRFDRYLDTHEIWGVEFGNGILTINGLEYIAGFIGIAIVIELVKLAVFYLATNSILSKHLNLE